MASFIHASECPADELYSEIGLKPPFNIPARKVSLMLDKSIDSNVFLARYHGLSSDLVPATFVVELTKALNMEGSPIQRDSRYYVPYGWPEPAAHFNRKIHPVWWEVSEGEAGEQFLVQKPMDTAHVQRTRGLLVFVRGDQLFLFHWNFQYFGGKQ